MGIRILRSMAVFSIVLLLIGQAMVPVRAETRPTATATLAYKAVLKTNKTITDVAGAWAHLGGKLYKGSNQVGYFLAFMRSTTGGTDALNVVFAQGTLMFLGSKPPQNMTIQGVVDAATGKFLGSISAATSAYKAWIGAQVKGEFNGNITITR